MSSSIELKKEQVTEISAKFKNSAAVVAFKYQGLTVEKFQSLRREARKNGVEVAVIKNNISARAAKENGYDAFADQLSGPIALAFAESDVVAPAKILFNAANEAGSKVEVITGVVDGDVYSFDQLKALSVLPSYETLLTQLAVGLLGTVRNLAVGLNMYVEKNQEGSEAQEA